MASSRAPGNTRLVVLDFANPEWTWDVPDYKELLERGWVENWTLEISNSPGDGEPERWWSALEHLASSDGLRVKASWSNVGQGDYRMPRVDIVRPDGTEYIIHRKSALEALVERHRQRREDWGETLADARARYGVVADR